MEELNQDNGIEQKEEELIDKNNENKSLITFAKLNKLFLIPFSFIIFNILSNVFEDLIVGNGVIKNPHFIISIFYDILYVLAGLFHFMSYFKTNENKNNESNEDIEQSLTTGINYIYIESILNLYNTNKILKIILLLGIMNAINDLIWVIVTEDIRNVFEDVLYYLFFIPLFSKIILKENIHKHHYFSFLISLIGVIFLIIPVCFHLTISDILPNILNFIKGINYPLFIVIIKYLIEKYYISPLKISLLIGILSIIINTIGYTIYSLINNLDFSLFTDCFDFSVENKLEISIYFILYFLFGTAAQLSLFLSIFYFSPSLIMVTNTFSPFIFWIFKGIKDGKNMSYTNILYPIGFIIVLFSAIIYNELIIFNCCDLNKDTKKFVNKRIYKELEEIKNGDDIVPNEIDNNPLVEGNDE